MKNNGFVEYVVHDLFAGIAGIAARAMFGGHGLYKNGLIFGIIIDGTLYFKVDDVLMKKYEAMGSRPFTYEQRGKTYALKYWTVPSEVLADRETLEQWMMWSCALSSVKQTKKAKK